MTREEARATALQIVDGERQWQADRFSTDSDDSTVHADLNHMVAVLSRYLGDLATEAVRQADYEAVEFHSVAIASVKVAAVATAIVESLIATGRVSSATLAAATHGGLHAS